MTKLCVIACAAKKKKRKFRSRLSCGPLSQWRTLQSNEWHSVCVNFLSFSPRINSSRSTNFGSPENLFQLLKGRTAFISFGTLIYRPENLVELFCVVKNFTRSLPSPHLSLQPSIHPNEKVEYDKTEKMNLSHSFRNCERNRKVKFAIFKRSQTHIISFYVRWQWFSTKYFEKINLVYCKCCLFTHNVCQLLWMCAWMDLNVCVCVCVCSVRCIVRRK